MDCAIAVNGGANRHTLVRGMGTTCNSGFAFSTRHGGCPSYRYVVEAPLEVQEEAEYVQFIHADGEAIRGGCDQSGQNPEVLAAGNVRCARRWAYAVEVCSPPRSPS